MSRKKAVDITGLSPISKTVLSQTGAKFKVSSKGIAGDNIAEGVPNYLQAPSEKVIGNTNNSWIVLGRDRPRSRLSGYGGKGDTQCGSIDIVVGRMGHRARKVDANGEQLWVDPDFKRDAARIYISQKTDIDENFGLADGKVGKSKTKSGIALKADDVRLIARQGIKLVTRTDVMNSQGGKVQTIPGIDLIAGNNDEDLQPMVKGNNTKIALERIIHHIDKLNGIVDAFLMAQMEMNEAATHHFHYSPFFALPTTPAIDVLVPKGIKTQIDLLSKVKRSLVAHKANLAAFKITYLNPAGSKYISSRYNNVN